MSHASLTALIWIAVIGAVILGALKAADYLKLRRMRALTCPRCHAPFNVPSTVSVKRWMEFTPDAQRPQTRTGFTLHCSRCSADYRFTDDCHLLDPTGDSSREATSNA